jgi:hypothetical protein
MPVLKCFQKYFANTKLLEAIASFKFFFVKITVPYYGDGVAADLEGVGRHILLGDGAKDLHPLGEHLFGDEVQRQYKLGQGKVDLQDLLLDSHRALAVIGQQLQRDTLCRRERKVFTLLNTLG